MNWEGFGRKWPWPNRGTIPAFAWAELRKAMRYFSIASFPAEIRNKNISNTSAELCRYTSLLGDGDVEIMSTECSTDSLSHLRKTRNARRPSFESGTGN
jgi:hypothetical protein